MTSQSRVWLAALALGGLGYASAASAMPVAPVGPEIVANGAVIEKVEQGCEPGIRRNRFGECRQVIGEATYNRRWRQRNGYNPYDEGVLPPRGNFERYEARRYNGYGGYGYGGYGGY